MNQDKSFNSISASASNGQRTRLARLYGLGIIAASLLIFAALTTVWSANSYAAPLAQTLEPTVPTVPPVVTETPTTTATVPPVVTETPTETPTDATTTPTVPPVVTETPTETPTATPTLPSITPTVPPITPTVPSVTVIYLGFKTSDEIEFDDDAQADFVYKNEDIVAFVPGTEPGTGTFSIFFDGSVCGLADANLDDFEVLPNGNILFTLRAAFDIPGLGEVDDSDVIEYIPVESGCGTFALRLKGADFGLTKGAEDIDGLGVDADGNLLISTIGTAKVPGSTGEIEAKDQDLLKLDETTGTWSIYFDGSNVGLTTNSEDIRSVSIATDSLGIQNVYLTLSGDFDVSSTNEDEGDKNDVEGCTPLALGEDITECTFFKFLDGETVNAENQLDGLSIVFGTTSTVTQAVTGMGEAESLEAAEASLEAADIAELLAEGDSEVTADDLFEAANQIYLPLVKQ